MSLRDKLEQNFNKAKAEPKYTNAPGSPFYNKAVKKYFREAKKAILCASGKKKRCTDFVVEWQSSRADTKQLANDVCTLLKAEGVDTRLGSLTESKWYYHQEVTISF